MKPGEPSIQVAPLQARARMRGGETVAPADTEAEPARRAKFDAAHRLDREKRSDFPIEVVRAAAKQRAERQPEPTK